MYQTYLTVINIKDFIPSEIKYILSSSKEIHC